jgi:hypothetical protein
VQHNNVVTMLYVKRCSLRRRCCAAGRWELGGLRHQPRLLLQVQVQCQTKAAMNKHIASDCRGSTLSSARPAWSGSRTIGQVSARQKVHGIRRDCRDGLGGRQTARGRAPAVFQVAEGLAASCTRVVQNHPPAANSHGTATCSALGQNTEMKVLAGGKRSGG